MERRVFQVLLALVVLLGAYLRLVDLGGPSLWLDEILHLQVTQSLADEPWYGYLTGVLEINGRTENGALYYGLQLLGQRLAPGETGVRLFPAFIGILTLPLMALAGQLLGGRLTALAATFLLAVSPLHVYFSREGRPYSLLMALALLLLYALLQKGSRAGIWTAYAGCLLGAYVGIHSVPILLSFLFLSVLALWWSRKDGGLRRSPYGHFVVAASLALALAYGLYMTRSDMNTPGRDLGTKSALPLQESPIFRSPLSARSLEMLLASMTTSGHPSVLLVPRSWVLIVLACAGLAVLAQRRPRVAVATGGMFLLPVVLSIVALVSVARWYGINYTSTALPAFLLLVAVGVTVLAELAGKLLGGKTPQRRAVATWAAAGGLLLLFAAPNLAAARVDPQRKADWRGVARFFDEVALDGEPILIPNPWPQICLDHYLQELGRDVHFINLWESAAGGQAVVDDRPQGWLLTAGFRKKNEVRAWMHRFVPVLKQREQEVALFFFPDFVTLLETRFAAQKGTWFESRFASMGQRFDFGGGESTMQGRGWSYAEEDGHGTGFQWAVGEQAELGLPIGPPRDTAIRFRALPFVYPEAPPQHLEIWLNEEHLATLDLPFEWSEQEIEVPASSWSSGANILYLRFARSTRPAAVVDGSQDRRYLSAAFDYLEVVR